MKQVDIIYHFYQEVSFLILDLIFLK